MSLKDTDVVFDTYGCVVGHGALGLTLACELEEWGPAARMGPKPWPSVCAEFLGSFVFVFSLVFAFLNIQQSTLILRSNFFVIFSNTVRKAFPSFLSVDTE